ncbi:hypothetical protein LCGC14_0681460, partial [marine sediment metagenome]
IKSQRSPPQEAKTICGSTSCEDESRDEPTLIGSGGIHKMGESC